MQFDRATQVVAQGEQVVFGSSVDGTVTCLHAVSGEVVWTYSTEGPIRFAPVLWQDRAFVGSDDGYLYALGLADGALLWKRRGGPTHQTVLGNQQMISRWPLRGGPVVADAIVYFAAGIWPSEGIYVYAVDANTGDVIWQNVDSGSIYMPQPHSTAEAKSGVAAQGYLVVSGDRLFVPTGRAVPASFDRRTGKLEYFHLQKYGHNGESLVMVIGDTFFNGGIGFDVQAGHQLAKLGGGELAATATGLVRCFGNEVAEYCWQEEEKPDRKGEPEKVRSLVPLWKHEAHAECTAVISAGSQIVMGGRNRVTLFDTAARKMVWQADVDGVAYALAVARQRLLVSTDRGTIHCFAAQLPPRETVPPVAATRPSAPGGVERAGSAEEIIQRTGVTQGYCLDLGCGDGALASELAKRTQLQIVAVDPDADNVRSARTRLAAEGFYGSRVMVLQRELTDTGLPPYFADLIVSGRALDQDISDPVLDEARRLQRPCGGILCLTRQGTWQVTARGALEGSGNWTHQYADPANTVNSSDSLINGQLSMLWYRDLDFAIPSRHGRAPSPLYLDGRLLHESMNGLVAVDAYNGRELWRYDIPDVLKAYDGDELMGVAGTGSNFCVGGDSVYVRDGSRCLRLQLTSGTLTSEYVTPVTADGKHESWGYIAWADGVLFGSTANAEHIVTFRYLNRGGDMTKQLTESKTFFAIDAQSGDLLWRYDAKKSIRHNAIAVANGMVFLIDRPLALFDREKKPASKEHPTGKLVALDARTGNLIWQNDQDIFGTMLAVSTAHNVVLMSYQSTRFQLDSEFGGRMAGLRADTGERLWDIPAKYESRPTLNDRTIYTQGGAWDLLTGQAVPFQFKRSYGCGILASSRDMLLFRSATLGYYDLAGARETVDYGGIRPGCWINALPVGGLVLVPDASAGCACSYQNRSWMALSGTHEE